MRETIDRRLIILFVLSLFISLGAITIGILGFMDLIESGFVQTIQGWIEPVISIRRDGPPISSNELGEEPFSALDVQATQMADKREQVMAIFAEWPVIFRERYVSNDVDWPIFTEDGDLAAIDVSIEGGKYRWDAQAKQGFVWWAYPNLESLSNVYVEVEATQLEGATYGEMGLVVRLTEDRFYLFRVSGGEYYSLYRSDPDGWSDLIEWTRTNTLSTTGTNTIGLLAFEDHFYLFINDHLIAEATDEELDAGVVGVAVGLDEEADEGLFEFDNLVIKSPETTTEATPSD